MNKKLATKINRHRAQLSVKTEKTGLYENFGQKEIRTLKDEFSVYEEDNGKQIREFEEWCMNYEG